MESGSWHSSNEDEISSGSIDVNSSFLTKPDELAGATTAPKTLCVSGDAISPSQPKPSNANKGDPKIWNETLRNTSDGASHSISQIETPAVNNKRGVNGTDNFNDLGVYWIKQFEISGKVEEINRAIEYLSWAVYTTTDGHVGRPIGLTNLGVSHLRRFEHFGDLADLNKAIACQFQALALTPESHTDKPCMLDNLGISCLRRFMNLGELADIDRAITCQYQAVLLAPDGHPEKHSMLCNLGNSHLWRFTHLGELADVDRAITYQSQAVQLTPDGDVGKPGNLGNLGISHKTRFERLGDLADIDRAIACQYQAVLLTPDGHANKRGMLLNLGSSHLTRFEHLGDKEDIDKAIAYQSLGARLIPEGHADKPSMLEILGNSYHRRFDYLRDLPDIDRAIECHSEAVLLTPDGRADNAGKLSNLGVSHICRFEHLEDLADINKAIACLSQAASMIPDGHAGKLGVLNNLGVSHRSRFKHLGDLADIDKAIECQSQAVALTPDGHAGKARFLDNLGDSHHSRCELFGDLADIQGLLASFKMAAHCPTGGTYVRFDASRQWAKLSVRFDPPSSLSAYQWTIDMVPEVVWIGSTISRRYERIRLIGDLAVEAAAVAISAQEYGLALEWLEAGRSVVWSQTLQLRSQFDNLFMVDSNLATSLRNAAIALEHASSRTSPGSKADHASTSEDAIQQHHRQAEHYDELLRRAREVPGFHNLMRPRRTTDLLSAARSGPIVVVNMHASRCDALILRPNNNEIAHVHLTGVSDAKMMELQLQMQGYISRRPLERRPCITPRRSQDSIESILSILWHNIAKPVLTCLGYTLTQEKLPADQLPHITWCATGALAMLPIHAAGCYDHAGNNLFSYAISSYAPTLSSLMSSEPCPVELGAILAVSQEATLPATKQELAHIKRLAGELPYLQLEKEEATADAVLNAMEQFNSVHFACHASQNLSQPLQSCFHLHDRDLSLADITKRSLNNKELAFLSACQTATGHAESPDEAIHLAAGMLVAGYPTVIATMWSIIDNDAPLVADRVYGQLTKSRRIDNGRVARALHTAVAALRDRVGEKAFVRWVPYIHMGV